MSQCKKCGEHYDEKLLIKGICHKCSIKLTDELNKQKITLENFK